MSSYIFYVLIVPKLLTLSLLGDFHVAISVVNGWLRLEIQIPEGGYC